MKCTIAFFSAKKYDKLYFDALKGDIKIFYFEEAISKEFFDRKTDCDRYDFVCTFVNDTVDAALLDVLKSNKVKGVLNRCAGFDRVDVVYADKIGLPVCRVPAYSPYAVAEHAVSLLCTLNRKLHIADSRTSRSNFDIDGLTGFDLRGKTIGVVGTGKIGQILIDIMTGFGCKIAAFDVFINPEYEARKNVTYMTLDEVYACSDVISLHSPLLPSTKHMINKESVAKMKDGVIIINCARGGLIDTTALVAGIASGKIGGAGLDVYENESGLFFNDCSDNPAVLKDNALMALMASNRCLISSHQAFLTREALEAIATTTINNVKEILKGKTGKDLSAWVSPDMAA